jgi:hypothetical protein
MESPVYIETFDVHFEHCTVPFAQLAETSSFTMTLYSFPEYSSFPEDGARAHEMKERDDSHSHPAQRSQLQVHIAKDRWRRACKSNNVGSLQITRLYFFLDIVYPQSLSAVSFTRNEQACCCILA